MQPLAILPAALLAEAFAPGLSGILLLLALFGFVLLTGLLTLLNLALICRLKIPTPAKIASFLGWCLYAWLFAMIALGQDKAIFPPDTTGKTKDLVSLAVAAAIWLHFILMFVAWRRSSRP